MKTITALHPDAKRAKVASKRLRQLRKIGGNISFYTDSNRIRRSAATSSTEDY